MKEVEIEIPGLPPKECSPNWRGYWAVKSRAVKKFRETSALCALAATHSRRPNFAKAILGVTFVVRDSRSYKDPDNALASLKPAIDGCVDAGVIAGDDKEHIAYRLPIMWKVRRKEAPMTIISIEEVSELPTLRRKERG